MQQRFTKTVQRFSWIVWIMTLLGVIQRDEECCLFHSIKTLLVLPPSKVCITGACPRHPKINSTPIPGKHKESTTIHLCGCSAMHAIKLLEYYLQFKRCNILTSWCHWSYTATCLLQLGQPVSPLQAGALRYQRVSSQSVVLSLVAGAGVHRKTCSP